MLVDASLAPLSVAQLKKLHSGKPVRVRHGNAHTVQVMPMQLKKLMKAHMMGKGMVMTVPPPTTKPYYAPVMGGNLIATSKDAGKALITAGADRGVQAIEGSGVPTLVYRKVRGGNLIATSKDAGKSLITAGADRGVQAIEGSGSSRDFNLKETINQIKQGRPFKKKDGTVPLSVQAFQSGKPFGGQIGGSRVDKFSKWTKAIGHFVKPVAQPILGALTDRATDSIMSYNNPQYVVQTGLDMFQREAPQTIQALTGSPEQKEFESLAPAEPISKPRRGRKPRKMPVVYAEPVAEKVNIPNYSFPQVPQTQLYTPSQELPYEPVVWYGSGMKKGSPAMKAKMAQLRAMKKGGNLIKTSKTSAKRLIEASTDRAVRALEGSGKGSQFMKDKMAKLRAMRKKKGGALYPAGGALYPAGYSYENS